MDIDIVEQAKKGNKEAFTKLIEENKFKIYKTAKAILKDEDDVCDAIQDSLIRAYNGIGKLKNNEFFTTWIIRIVINKCYDIAKIKNKQKQKIVNIKEVENLKSYDTYNEDSIVEKILNQIEEDLKIVTIMYYYDDTSVKDISKILKIPEGTVKSRLSRARTKIYEIVRKEEQ